jgi:hypothetical protein
MQEDLVAGAPGEPLSPSLMARAFRGIRERDPQRAEEIRERLHENVVLRDPVATEVLRLLSDDSFWRLEEPRQDRRGTP